MVSATHRDACYSVSLKKAHGDLSLLSQWYNTMWVFPQDHHIPSHQHQVWTCIRSKSTNLHLSLQLLSLPPLPPFFALKIYFSLDIPGDIYCYHKGEGEYFPRAQFAQCWRKGQFSIKQYLKSEICKWVIGQSWQILPGSLSPVINGVARQILVPIFS